VKAAEAEAMCKKSELSKLMAPEILSGLQALDRLVKEHNVQGVLGPVIDLVDCRESMRKAVEVWACMASRCKGSPSCEYLQNAMLPLCELTRLTASRLLLQNLRVVTDV
jgi:hypothetical protein